jgi:hypothetical protein
MGVNAAYDVISGRRVVATRNGASAREVALDYVRSLGYKRDEIIYYGSDGVAWRGAIYRARLAEPSVAPPN